MPKTSSLAIDALPDGVLGDILAASGRPAGPAVTLVCRRWHRVYYEQPSIWRNLRLHVRPGPQQMWQTEVGCRVLRRVEGHVGLLSLVNPSCWPQQTTVSLDSLLDQLQLGRLAGLHYGYEVWSPSLAGLQPLSNQLTSLEVKVHALAAGCSQTLRVLERLQHLGLCTRCDVPSSVVSAAAQLSHLTSLRLDAQSDSSLPTSELQLLVQLPSLRSLRLSGRAGSGIDILALPAPTDFPALQDCQYRGDGCQIQVAGARLRSYSWQTSCASWAGLYGVQQQLQLADLLRRLTPRRAVLPVPRLCLYGRLHPQLCTQTPQLACVTSLHVGVNWTEQQMPQLLDTLLPQAPLLAELDLFLSCAGPAPALPDSVIHLQGLKALRLGWELVELPAGNYLSGLTKLDLRFTSMRQLPPLLTQMSQLQRLLVTELGLQLQSSDVCNVLACLPALQFFELWSTAPQLRSVVKMLAAMENLDFCLDAGSAVRLADGFHASSADAQQQQAPPPPLPPPLQQAEHHPQPRLGMYGSHFHTMLFLLSALVLCMSVFLACF